METIITRCVLICEPGQIGEERHIDYYDAIQQIGKYQQYDIVRVNKFSNNQNYWEVPYCKRKRYLLKRGKYEILRNPKSLVI